MNRMFSAGTPLQNLTTPALTRTALARFAGAIDDYNPVHLDDKVATATGKSSVFAPATMIMAYIGRMLSNNLPNARISSYQLRALKFVWPGDVLTCRGVVVSRKDDVIEIDVWADNQRGETVAKGQITTIE
jgi:acyl dehydratase